MDRYVFIDQLRGPVPMENPPERIVSLVPSQTELLADLGLGDKVVGITKFCVHPRQWFKSKVRVGGTKDVNISRVESLKPDLIIANKEENVAEQVEVLRTIAPVWVSDVKDLVSALGMIHWIGRMTDTEQHAVEIKQNILERFRHLKPLPCQLKAVYLIWRRPYMAAGSDTFISAMMAHCGLSNAVTMDRYPKLTKKDLRSLDPEVVLLSSEPYPFKEKHLEEIKTILPRAKVLLVDGEMFSWYGSRMMQAPVYLQKLVTGLAG